MMRELERGEKCKLEGEKKEKTSMAEGGKK